MPRPARVLILGGGFAAVGACRRMRSAIDRGELEATVVTRDTSLLLHGLIAEMLTGRISAGAPANPARRVFRPARVHFGEVESIDLEHRRVVVARSLDGAHTELDYDHAVLALGTAEDLDAYPGIAEHAFRLKRLDDCLRLKNHLLTMFELAEVEPDAEERARLLTFVVAGGGFSGTELAGELADLARVLTRKEFPGIRREECRVVLVHPGPSLLPEFYGARNLERPVKSFPRLVEYATRHARKLGVELFLETRVAAATPGEVRLSSGDRIETRTIVSAVGTRPNPLVESLPVEHDDRGRMVVDRFLRVEGRDDLWSGGDCAAVPHPKGGTCSPQALYGLAHGRTIGDNIVRSVRGRPLKAFRKDVRMQGVSIGRRTAVGEMYGIGFRGKLAWAAWRTIIFQVAPTWDRRLRLFADWSIWPIVGRDITQLGSALRDDYEVEHYVFQPGETIFDARRPTRYVHVLVEGTAAVVGEGGETVATLGPGSSAGLATLQEAGGELVRANSLVRTVALRFDQAQRLQSILAAAGPLGGAQR
jgi:NADH:ubiquinone reductase (H+-translocating)